MIALLAVAALQAASVEAPAWSAPTSLGTEAAGQCVEQMLRGKRLGLNILTLRPARYVMGDGEVIEVGPGIRFVVSPSASGATISLYSRAWIPRLASFVRPCVVAAPAAT